MVVDEVQRVPALLHEVHALISESGRRYRFALSGSSARKLKRLDVDLLAGRVVNRQFFPLTAAEVGTRLVVDDVLRLGLLPQIRSDRRHAIDTMDAYVGNYLREEVQQEALVRRLDSFARFLQVAANCVRQLPFKASAANCPTGGRRPAAKWTSSGAGRRARSASG